MAKMACPHQQGNYQLFDWKEAFCSSYYLISTIFVHAILYAFLVFLADGIIIDNNIRERYSFTGAKGYMLKSKRIIVCESTLKLLLFSII